MGLAHVLVVLYVLLGSSRGGASVMGLLSGHGVRARALGNVEANTTKWLQQVWAHGRSQDSSMHVPLHASAGHDHFCLPCTRF